MERKLTLCIPVYTLVIKNYHYILLRKKSSMSKSRMFLCLNYLATWMIVSSILYDRLLNVHTATKSLNPILNNVQNYERTGRVKHFDSKIRRDH